MGADAITKENTCIRTSQLLRAEKKVPDVTLLLSEDSTLPIAKAVELVNKCNNLKSHDDELKAFREVGSKTPILPSEIGTDSNYQFTYVWFNLIGFVILHMIGLSGALAAILGYCQLRTTLYCKQNVKSI